MFTVKLGTGKTFEATAAEEAYGAVYGGSPRLTLRLEASPAPRGLDWYLGLLEEEGALDIPATQAHSPMGRSDFLNAPFFMPIFRYHHNRKEFPP